MQSYLNKVVGENYEIVCDVNCYGHILLLKKGIVLFYRFAVKYTPFVV